MLHAMGNSLCDFLFVFLESKKLSEMGQLSKEFAQRSSFCPLHFDPMEK